MDSGVVCQVLVTGVDQSDQRIQDRMVAQKHVDLGRIIAVVLLPALHLAQPPQTPALSIRAVAADHPVCIAGQDAVLVLRRERDVDASSLVEALAALPPVGVLVAEDPDSTAAEIRQAERVDVAALDTACRQLYGDLALVLDEGPDEIVAHVRRVARLPKGYAPYIHLPTRLRNCIISPRTFFT